MRARLIYPELVTIQPINRLATQQDVGGQEPTAHTARADSFTILAQVDERQRNLRKPSQGGAKLEVRTDFTFLRRDVQGKGWAPTDGDRVIQIANKNGTEPQDVNWYLEGPAHLAKERSRAKLIVMGGRTKSATRRRTEGL